MFKQLLTLAACLGALASAAPAAARTHNAKCASDLAAVIGARPVQAVVTSRASDPEMSDLRAFALRSGGSVLVRQSAIRGLTVLMNAGTLNAHSDGVVLSESFTRGEP